MSEPITLAHPGPVGSVTFGPGLSSSAPTPNGTVMQFDGVPIPNGAAPAHARGGPLALIDLMLGSSSIDLDRAERLLKMAVEWRAHEREEQARQATLAFRRNFAAFRGENIIVPKTKEVDREKGGTFMQAEFDVVCRMLSPALSKHGFGFRHDQKFGSRKWVGPVEDGGPAVERDVPWVTVTCFLEHREGHTETLTLEGPPGDAHANTPVQNMQVTGSYLKRQSLLAITGTATGGEDEEAKMRMAEAKERQKSEAEAEAEAIVEAGNEEARQGTASLNAWWGKLTPKQRTKHQRDFTAMVRTARAADAQKGGAK